MENAPAVSQGSALPTTIQAVNSVKERMNLVTTIYKEIMVRDQDFGVIPGCGTKPSLLKPGAEKLMMAFRISAVAEKVEVENIAGYLVDGHRDYRVTIVLIGPGGEMLGGGVGSCSTLEKKYRYRTGPKEMTDMDVPKEYWNLRKTNPSKAQDLLGGPGYSTAKDDKGNWKICEKASASIENPDPADQWNTCLKMAKKRALIDACLTSLGASTIFTQDIEDITDSATITTETKTEAAAPLQAAVDAAANGNTAQNAFEELKASATSAGAGVLAKFNKRVEEFLANEKTLEELNDEDWQNLVKYINSKRKAA
jgi:hypothetical protein